MSAIFRNKRSTQSKVKSIFEKDFSKSKINALLDVTSSNKPMCFSFGKARFAMQTYICQFNMRLYVQYLLFCLFFVRVFGCVLHKLFSFSFSLKLLKGSIKLKINAFRWNSEKKNKHKHKWHSVLSIFDQSACVVHGFMVYGF